MTEQEIILTLNLIKSKKQKMNALREQIATTSSSDIRVSSFYSPKISGGTHKTPQERYTERIDRLKELYFSEWNDYYKLYDKMKVMDKVLSCFEYEVIFYLFYEGLPITKAMNYLCANKEKINVAMRSAIKKMSECEE